MIKVRRNIHEPRLEMTPMIDVVFLLLTFFIFSLVLMVRAEVLDVTLPTLSAGDPIAGADAITVAVDEGGSIYIDGEACAPGDVGTRVAEARRGRPEARVMVAADEGGRSGVLLGVLDALAKAGIADFSIVGRPKPEEP